LTVGDIVVRSTSSTTSESCCVDHLTDTASISLPCLTAAVCQTWKSRDLTADCFQIRAPVAVGCSLARRCVML